MYGGYDGRFGSGAEQYDEVWVLTLPAFHWMLLNTSHQSRSSPVPLTAYYNNNDAAIQRAE